jgi:anti-anti-sigma factor
MDIQQRTEGAITLLDPVGKLVLNDEPMDTIIKDTLTALMAQGCRQFVLNLQNISQVDTSGLTTLVAAHIAVMRRGGQLKLANPTKRLREVLGVTKLNTFLDVCDSERDAIECLAQESSSGERAH